MQLTKSLALAVLSATIACGGGTTTPTSSSGASATQPASRCGIRGHGHGHRRRRQASGGRSRRVRFRFPGQPITVRTDGGDRARHSLCFNNIRDFPGLGPDYICRTVRIVAPIDGVMAIEAISVANGTHMPASSSTREFFTLNTAMASQ